MKQKPKLTRKILRVLAILAFVCVLFFTSLLLPATQTYLGQRLTKNLDNRFGTTLTVDHIRISPFGDVTLKNIVAIDHKNATMIRVGFARMNAVRLWAVLQGDNNLGSVFLQDVGCNIITYMGDENSNIDLFFDRFNSKKPKNNNAAFYVSAIDLMSADLIIHNENEQESIPIRFTSMHADIENFSVVDSIVKAKINQLDTKTNWKNTQITSLAGTYVYSSTEMKLVNATLQTNASFIESNIVLQYPKKGLKNFADAVQLDVKINKAVLGDLDLKKAIPNWSLGNIDFSGVIGGTVQNLSITKGKITNDKALLDFSLETKELLDSNKRHISSNWTLDSEKLDLVFNSLLSKEQSDFIAGLGPVSTSGNMTYSNHVFNLKNSLDSELGALQIDATYDIALNIPAYTIKLNTELFNVGELLEVPTLKTTGFDILLSGNGLYANKLNVNASGSLLNLSYRDYVYDKVELEGNLSPEKFQGKMYISGAALDLNLEGEIDFASATRNFSFSSNINKANFAALGWIPETIPGVFSGSVDLALQGNTIDEMIGDLYIEQGKLETPNKTYSFSSFAAQSRLSNKLRVININSEDVATGLMIGDFKPTELVKLTQNALGNQYGNYTPHKITPNQYVDFNFNLRGKIASALFGDGMTLDDNTFIKGSIKPSEKLFQLNIRAPKWSINETTLNKLELQIDTQNPLYHSYLSLEKLESAQGILLNLNWINSRIKDKLYGRVEFASNTSPNKLNQLNTSFTINENSHAVLGIQNADFYFNNKQWKLNPENTPPQLIAKSIKDFSLSTITLGSNNSKISLSASQNGKDSFSLALDLEKVALSDILSFEDNKWEGVVDGFLYIEQTSNGFGGNSNLAFSKIKLNSSPLGDGFLTLNSESARKSYDLNFRLEENGAEVISASGNIGLMNDIPIWNIDASFSDYNLSALAGLTHAVFNPFNGNANGDIQLRSENNKIYSTGTLEVDALRLGIPYLNTMYSFSSTVPFVFGNDEISIQNALLSDQAKNTGLLDGVLSHQSFSDWGLDMRLKTENLSVLDTDFSEDALYYGNAFFTGNTHFHGLFSDMEIDVIGQTAKGTSLFIPIQYDTAIGDVSFINFVEKDAQDFQKNNAIDAVKGLKMNFDLDITPDAQVEIVVDPETKSFLRGIGAGNLLLEIDTAGSFAMWGDFIAYEGIYNFKNLGLIDKTFRLRPGGTIVWEGDPYGAQINMQAEYEVPGGANPSILLEGDMMSQKIPTEVTINLFGNLLNPETPTFEIDFPNASGVMKNELNYRLNDQERTQLQAISLLSQGSFINQVSLAAISSQTLTNNLFQKASGVFDNIFYSENDKLNLSLDYLQGDRNAAASIQNRDRLGVSLSTNISERIIIDGKVGVPVGSEEETTIIGDVTIEFLLNKKGTLRGRVFNKENEFQYFGDELGYTQGFGVNYQVRFDSFNELLRKILNK